jgi:hypothetical protein
MEFFKGYTSDIVCILLTSKYILIKKVYNRSCKRHSFLISLSISFAASFSALKKQCSAHP